MNTFIHLRSDGSVRISGGVVFCRGNPVYAELRNVVPPLHEVEGNIFITQLPKWWQLIRWYKIICIIKAHTVDT